MRLTQFVGAVDLSTAAARESRAYSLCNATPGTGIAVSTDARTTLANTEAALAIQSGTDGPGLMLRRINLLCRTAGTGITAIHVALAIDSAWRRTSGGTALTLSSMTSHETPTLIEGWFGNITVSAPSSNSRVVWHEQLTAAAPTVGQSIALDFTGAGAWPPVFVPPTRSLVLYYWATGQSAAPTFEPKILLAAT